jgi:cell division protein FtsQ
MNKTLKIILSIVFGLLVLFVLISARKHQAEMQMVSPEIHLEVIDGMTLITKSEIEDLLMQAGLFNNGIKRSDFDIKSIESFLAQTNEIESVEVFTKLDGEWHIKARLKRPIVRVIDPNNTDFYLDSKGSLMGISPYYRPKVLAVTGMNTLWGNDFEYQEVINNDSLITKYKLRDLYLISSYVCNDAFYDALIVQIEYTKDLGFILVPRLGNQRIVLGDGFSKEEINRKFLKLTTFYEEVIPYEGWDAYKKVDLRFENQIVAKKN